MLSMASRSRASAARARLSATRIRCSLAISAASCAFSRLISVQVPTMPPSLVRRSQISSHWPSPRSCSIGSPGLRWRCNRSLTHSSVRPMASGCWPRATLPRRMLLEPHARHHQVSVLGVHPLVRAIGQDEAVVGVEEREPVADAFDGVAQADLGGAALIDGGNEHQRRDRRRRQQGLQGQEGQSATLLGAASGPTPVRRAPMPTRATKALAAVAPRAPKRSVAQIWNGRASMSAT